MLSIIKRSPLRLLFILLFAAKGITVCAANAGNKADTIAARAWLDKVEAYSDSAKYDSAAYCYEKAAGIYKKMKNREKYIFCRNGIFVELRNKHDNADLMPMVRENMKLALKYLPPSSPVLGDCYMNIGHVFSDRSNLDSAFWYFQKGMEIWKLSYGDNHIKIANAYGNLGIICNDNARYDEAEEYQKRALEIRINILGNDHPDIAFSYNSLGYLAYTRGMIDECAIYFLKALEIRETYYGKDHPLTAESYNNYAALCLRREDYQQSLYYNHKALEARLKSLGSNNPNVALSYNNLGNVYSSIGEFDKAVEYHQKALQIRLELWGDTHTDVAMSYQNIGVMNFKRGEYRAALENAMEVLRILENIYGKNHHNLDDAYNNIGAAYNGLGDYANAYDNLYKALELRRSVSPDNPALTVSYNNVGAMCKNRGDYDMARSYYLKKLELLNRYYNYETLELAGSYNNLGELYYYEEDYFTALEYYRKCRDIRIRLQGKLHPDLAGSLINISSVYEKMDSLERQAEIIDEGLHIMLLSFGELHPRTCKLYAHKARNLHKRGHSEEAFSMQRHVIQLLHAMYNSPHPGIAGGYIDYGIMLAQTGQPDSALFFFNKALEVNYYGGLPNDINLVEHTRLLDELDFLETLCEKAAVEYNLYETSGNTEMLLSSVNTYKAATRLAWAIREDFTLPDSKILLLNSMADVYSNAVKAAYKLSRFETEPDMSVKAFYFSEMNKAAVLLETMRRCRIENYRNIPESLLEKERELLRQISYYKNRITVLQEEETDSLSKQTDYFSIRYANAVLELAELKEECKRFLAYPPTASSDNFVSINEIQEQLGNNTVMLEYFIGDSSLYIFVLGNTFMEVCEVAGISSLNYMVLEHLANIKKYKPNELKETAKSLFDILIGPVQNYLEGKTRLLIIPDKHLLYLPFETLVSDIAFSGARISETPRFLLYDFEITYHYSASLWMEVSRRKPPHNEGFLGIAPVFSKENLVSDYTTQRLLQSLKHENLRSSLSANGTSMIELPYSMEEISGISSLFAEKNLPVAIYLSEHATEFNLKQHCADFGFIHLATHGLVNPEKPDLSGLVFTDIGVKDAVYSEERSEQMLSLHADVDDGILFAHEIYNLRLNADLVVLSACETGIGKLEAGEGVMSLNRAFLYAGAQNVVSSFWKVNDKYTSELMTWFYTYIIEGQSYSKALQLAKLKLLENEVSGYPLFWAGFALFGK